VRCESLHGISTSQPFSKILPNILCNVTLLKLFLPLVAFSILSKCNASLPKEFDFIIVGGGTAGLIVANRLTELPDITVAVIEAGEEVFNNPNVTDPEKFTVALGTPIDW